MSRFARHLLSRPLLLGILLSALVLRGLVPAGYMPATGEAFAIEMCRVGLPAGPVDEGASQPGSHDAADSSFCSYGSAPGAGPAPSALTARMASQVLQSVAVDTTISPVLDRRSHDRQAQPPVLS